MAVLHLQLKWRPSLKYYMIIQSHSGCLFIFFHYLVMDDEGKHALVA